MALIKINNRSSVDTVSKGRRNYARNGAMMINQRGDRLAVASWSAKKLADGYSGVAGGINPSMNYTQERDAPTGTGLEYSLKWEVTTADTLDNTAEEYFGLLQYLEAQQSLHLHSEDNVTISFWVKSNVTGTYTWNLQLEQTDSVYTTDPRVGYMAEYTINSANTWEQKIITIPLSTAPYTHDTSLSGYDAQYRGFALTWMISASSGGTKTRNNKNTGWLTPTSDGSVSASADFRNGICTTNGNQTAFTETVGNYIQITGVQFEAGDVASQFEHRSYTDELMDAYRYCYRINQHPDGAGSSAEQIMVCLVPNSNTVRGFIQSPVPMRGNSISKSASAVADIAFDVQGSFLTGLTNIDYKGSTGNNQFHGFEFDKSAAFGSYLGDACIMEFTDSVTYGGSGEGWFQLESEM